MLVVWDRNVGVAVAAVVHGGPDDDAVALYGTSAVVIFVVAPVIIVRVARVAEVDVRLAVVGPDTQHPSRSERQTCLHYEQEDRDQLEEGRRHGPDLSDGKVPWIQPRGGSIPPNASRLQMTTDATGLTGRVGGSSKAQMC